MSPPTPRPAGFVHVDLDGLWTLAGVYGFPEADLFERDPVFEVGVARLLALFGKLGLSATFFIVGRDLEIEGKAAVVSRIAAAGHRLANHSLSHDLRLGEASPEDMEAEMREVNRRLIGIDGRRPLGFRAPGYAASEGLLAACTRAGLAYDGSRLPTWWAPVLRRLARRLQRPATGVAAPSYGGGGSLAPQWQAAGEGRLILRLPVAVSPRLRLPLHASLGMLLGSRFVRQGLRGLASRGLPAVYLLHGIDLIGGEEFAHRLPAHLARHRAYRIPLAHKQAFLESVLGDFRHRFVVQTTEDWLAHMGSKRAELFP